MGITATVTSYALNVRSGPGIGYARIVAIPRGTLMTLLARTADSSWVKVLLASGVQGWVNSGYIAPSAPLTSLPVEGVVVPAAATAAAHHLPHACRATGREPVPHRPALWREHVGHRPAEQHPQSAPDLRRTGCC
ncbi:MAG: hypothetical protein KatS3mg051_1317 [Anaerolineae bacterium]|nr:MAG: hypothetical protein KatS3mg051_1317 [Anaerolineae bacterium]